MPRAIWSGSISFGLVNVPVKLYSATQQKDVRFHQFQRGTGERIRYRRVAEESQEEVDYEDIVKGYEMEKGRYVIVTPEELEAVEPEKSGTIDLEDFIELAEIDPIYFEKTYYLAPDERAERPYALLRDAMADEHMVGIARFVMRTKQYLAAIRPDGDMLLLETMFFPDEIRDRNELDIPGDVEMSGRERDVARRLIQSLSTKWDPDRYHDTYRERVLELIDKKAAGEEVVVARPEPKPDNVVDLLAALEESLARAGKGGDGGDGGGGRKARASGDGKGRYAGMSKQDLYEAAKERDISGRSKMSRDELIDALARAS